MYARSTTLQGSPGSLDDAIAYMRDEVWPQMQQMDGCVGLSMMCDRETGRCIATSAWRDQESMRAGADRVHPMRDRLMTVFGGGEPEVQEWEVAVLHRDHPAGDGACTRVTWVRTDPGRTDEMLDMYRSTVMPRIEAMPGFCSLSMLIDRETGHGVGSASFDSRESLEATREQARAVRESVTAKGVDIMDVAEMDLVLAHFRVPETV